MKADDEVDDGDSMAAYGEGDTGKISLLKPFLLFFLCFIHENETKKQAKYYHIHHHQEGR